MEEAEGYPGVPTGHLEEGLAMGGRGHVPWAPCCSEGQHRGKLEPAQPFPALTLGAASTPGPCSPANLLNTSPHGVFVGFCGSLPSPGV